MIGIGLCERVYGLRPQTMVREVVTSHPPTTEWDLNRHGWRSVRGIWVNGNDALRVHTKPQPIPSISALRWAYDGKDLQCLDPDHSHEIKIDKKDLDFLCMCVREEDGWKWVDPMLVISIVRLAEVLPAPIELDMDKVRELHRRCVMLNL